MKTWHFENAVVVGVLLAVWLATGHKPAEIIGSVAVFFGFCHASIAERMREREAARPVPSVECHAKSVWFFVGKEVCWFAYFAVAGAWSALVGCVLFAAYPGWRWIWRRYHPMQVNQPRSIDHTEHSTPSPQNAEESAPHSASNH